MNKYCENCGKHQKYYKDVGTGLYICDECLEKMVTDPPKCERCGTPKFSKDNQLCIFCRTNLLEIHNKDKKESILDKTDKVFLRSLNMQIYNDMTKMHLETINKSKRGKDE